MTRKIYAIAIENSETGQLEQVKGLPMMTLAQAQKAQGLAAQANIQALVVTTQAQ